MKIVAMLTVLAFMASCASTPAKKTESMDSQEVSMGMSSTERVALSEYVVEKNDTLMFIAFKVYGDYARWRDFLDVNDNLDYLKLTVGQVLYYETPSEKFAWERNGSPYLVQTGDTLGTISKIHFNTTKKWKDIYHNNLTMIKDPNKIFAGFTLYVPGFKKMAHTKK